MSEFLPKEVREGLARARKAALRKKSRLRVRVGEAVFPVLKLYETGFEVLREDAPHLRGLVDLYDGSRHLHQCLIVASEEAGERVKYEFKRATEVRTRAPLDFVRDENAPVALITDLAGHP